MYEYILKTLPDYHYFVSGHRKGETPDPISNSEVKPFYGFACTVLRTGTRTAADTSIYLLILCQLFSECPFLKLYVYILFPRKYIFGVNMECRKIGTDCGKSFSAEQRVPARRIFATALLVGGALFASCKSEPATPAHANVPVAAPAQVGGEQPNVSPARGTGGQTLSNPYMGSSETSGTAAGTGRGATRPGKGSRGAKDLDSGGGVVQNPFGGEEQQGSTSEETQDAGAEQESSSDSSQGGRGGAGNPWGGGVVSDPFGGEETQDAGAESNRGGSNPHNDSPDAGSSSPPDERGATNPHEIRSDAGTGSEAGADSSADAGGRIINPFEK